MRFPSRSEISRRLPAANLGPSESVVSIYLSVHAASKIVTSEIALLHIANAAFTADQAKKSAYINDPEPTPHEVMAAITRALFEDPECAEIIALIETIKGS